MNSGRKILKQPDNKAKKRKKKPVANSNAPRIIITTVVTVIVLVVAFVLYEQFHPKLVLTVDGENLYLSDLMYDVYESEKSYNSMEELYKTYYGKSFWEMEVSEGVSGRDAAKDEVISIATKREVLYQKAVQEGYALTDEEKETIQKEVEETRKELSVTQKWIGGLSEKQLTERKERDTIAKRYEQDKRDAYPIDQAALTADINRDELRQYDVQYYSVSYDSDQTDDEGNPVPVSDEEKAKRKAELEALYAKAETAEDFAALIGEDEETDVTYSGDANFVEKEEDFLSEELRNSVKAMANDSISGILEDDKGCYFVKMINNNSSERYDTEVENAINAEKDKLFGEEYDKIIEEMSIELNDKEWDRITMGKVTV